MLTEYLQAALERAQYEKLPDDLTYYGEIPGFQGVWANAATLETCRRELAEILEEWVLVRVADHMSLPVIDGLALEVKEVA